MKKTVTREASNLIGSASNIVLKAANILEQNIAEGILAAQKVERKFMDPEKIRADKDDVMNKFRKDTHQALDILFDTLTLATQKIQEFSSKIEEFNALSTSSQENSVPVLSLDKPISPSDEIVIPLTLENESKNEEMSVEFYDQGLRADEENIINKRNITYDPKVLTLKPGEKGVVNIKIYVPKTTKDGFYSGMIQAKNIPNLEAILKVDVKGNGG